MDKATKTRAIILLLILIAIGGIVMYGQNKPFYPKYGTHR